MSLIERVRAWMTAGPADDLPIYPCLPAPEPRLGEQIGAEIARIDHYRREYGIAPDLTLDIWRRGLSVDAVIERMQQNAERAP